MAGSEALAAHLAEGVTTVARAWEVTRKDGQRFGFTDHDLDLSFDGLVFRADTGMSAAALQQGAGLSVDNTEAVGALSHDSVTEADIAHGRFDGARVTAWLVNWMDPSARKVLFRGALGEITRTGGAFTAELRGLTEWLNRPVGRVFQRPCTAVLGDAGCGVDLSVPGMRATGIVTEVTSRRGLVVQVNGDFEPEWFQRGRLNVLGGPASGLWAAIKQDVLFEDGARRVDLWEPMRAEVGPGTQVELVVGCDKRFETCRTKFDNLLNYRGFPDVPQEEWILVHPTMTSRRDGGSLR